MVALKDIHIGSIIRKYIYNHGISPQWLPKLGCNRVKFIKLEEKKHRHGFVDLISNVLNIILDEYKEEQIAIVPNLGTNCCFIEHKSKK